MNHGKRLRKLGRNPAHRRALMRNMATALVLNERIETTLPKAKELRRVADKLVTLGKKNSLHARRQAMSYLMPINREQPGNAQKTSAVHKLFEELAPRYENRSGGYTRVIRGRKDPEGKRVDGRRDGDGAQMAIIEFVEEEVRQAKPKKRKRRTTKRVAAPAQPEPMEAAAEEAPTTEEAEGEAAQESEAPSAVSEEASSDEETKE